MKKILLAVLALAMLLCGMASASENEVFELAISNATFLITEINSAGTGFESDGVFDDPSTNTIAISFEAEDYSFSDFREIKKNDKALYQSLIEEFISLSNEFNAVCDVDFKQKIHVVFTVLSNDGVGLFLTYDQLDLTWMIAHY